MSFKMKKKKSILVDINSNVIINDFFQFIYYLTNNEGGKVLFNISTIISNIESHKYFIIKV